MNRTLIAVPAAAVLAGGALVSGAGPVAAAPAAPAAVTAPAQIKIPTYAKGRPVTAAHFRHYKLKKKELKQIAKAQRWAKTRKSRSVIQCESNGNYKLVDGPYHGAWQFLTSTWLSSGGGRYERTASKAPKFAQNHIAWKLWKHSGWGPWSCA